MAKIYIVEDNESIRDAVSQYLQLDDHSVLEFPGLTGVLESMEHQPPELVIIDIMLPDGSGYTLAKEIRMRSDVPIMFLTARQQESDRITGFEVGADDYVVKPFSPKELVLRAQALLKRYKNRDGDEESGGRWTCGNDRLTLDDVARKAYVNGEELKLTNAEWNILEYLAHREGQAIARERILGECLGYLYEGSERTVDTHIANIRGRLGDAPWIETVRGYGYRFAGRRE